MELLLLLSFVFSLQRGEYKLQSKSFTYSSIHPNLPYDEKLRLIRENDFKRMGNIIYFDSAQNTLFSDSQFSSFIQNLKTHLYGNPHSESPSSALSTDVSEEIRRSVLKYFGASPTDYTIIFTYSLFQSLKFVLETFPFNSSVSFNFTDSATNDILRLRTYPERNGAQLNSPSSTLTLIAVSLVDEFSGEVKDLDTLIQQPNNTHILVDASLYLQQNALNLSQYPFDAVAISFDRWLGFPQLGALMIKNTLIPLLQKPYFGGGSLVYALTETDFEKPRVKPAERFEDGSIPFLSISAVQYGLDFQNILGYKQIQEHISSLNSKFRKSLSQLKHQNGIPLCIFYSTENSQFTTFNLQSSNRELIDYHDIVQHASENDFYIVGGCHSTPGTCYQKLNEHTNFRIEATENHKDDFLEKYGAIRVSVGWFTTQTDVEKFQDFLSESYL